VLFFGDFFQLPSVSKLDLWRGKLGRWHQGHDLWRSLNAVVTLTQQMRQAEDPKFAEAMAQIHIHEPTDEDITMLNTRIGAPIPDSPAAPIIVRRHYVQDWQSVGPCRVYALAPIRPIDLGIRILQVRSGISMAGFMLGSVRNRQSMK